MTITDLLNKILYLVPNAKCSIQESLENNDVTDPVFNLCGLYVVWNITNNSECPTQDQLDNVSQSDADNEQKQILLINKKEYLKTQDYVKAGYATAQISSPTLTLDQYVQLIINAGV